MKKIDHLSPSEQQHYILCDCGEYLDMRNLSEVFKHLHAGLPQPHWTHSVKKGEARLYTRSGKEIGLS